MRGLPVPGAEALQGRTRPCWPGGSGVTPCKASSRRDSRPTSSNYAPCSRPQWAPITIGGCRRNNAGLAGYFYSSHTPGWTPAKPRGNWAKKGPVEGGRQSALQETEEGLSQPPAAPGNLLVVCLLPDSKTIGVSAQVRERREGGSAVLLCSLCSSREFLLYAQVPAHPHLPLPGLLVLWIFRDTGL